MDLNRDRFIDLVKQETEQLTTISDADNVRGKSFTQVWL